MYKCDNTEWWFTWSPRQVFKLLTWTSWHVSLCVYEAGSHGYVNWCGKTHLFWVGPFLKHGILDCVHGKGEQRSQQAAMHLFLCPPPFFLNCRFKCDQLLQASATVVAPAMRDCDLELWVELKSPQLSCFCQNIYHRNSKRNQDMCSILFFLYHALDTEPCFLHSFFLFRISTYLFYCWHLGFQFGTNMNICV